MEFVGKILVLLALAGIAAIEVYHKEENTGLMNLYLSAHAAGRAVRRHDEEEERLALVRARA